MVDAHDFLILQYRRGMFLATIMQMGYDIRDIMKNYWSTQQFYTPFYTNIMKHIFLNI
jgi:hypothetical protein